MNISSWHSYEILEWIFFSITLILIEKTFWMEKPFHSKHFDVPKCKRGSDMYREFIINCKLLVIYHDKSLNYLFIGNNLMELEMGPHIYIYNFSSWTKLGRTCLKFCHIINSKNLWGGVTKFGLESAHVLATCLLLTIVKPRRGQIHVGNLVWQ